MRVLSQKEPGSELSVRIERHAMGFHLNAGAVARAIWLLWNSDSRQLELGFYMPSRLQPRLRSTRGESIARRGAIQAHALFDVCTASSSRRFRGPDLVGTKQFP